METNEDIELCSLEDLEENLSIEAAADQEGFLISSASGLLITSASGLLITSASGFLIS
jgi:hypothetical protein